MDERQMRKRIAHRDYMRVYRLTHPEYRQKEVIRRAKSILLKAGYTITEPTDSNEIGV